MFTWVFQLKKTVLCLRKQLSWRVMRPLRMWHVSFIATRRQFLSGHFVWILDLDFHQFFPNVDWRETTNNHNFEPDVIMDSPITFGGFLGPSLNKIHSWKVLLWFRASGITNTVLSKRTDCFCEKNCSFFWHLSSLSVSLEIPWCPDGILRPISSSSIGIESLIHSEYVIPIRNVCRFASPKKVDFLNDFNKIPSDYSFVVLDFCVPSYLGERSLTSIKLQGGWNHQTATR